METYNDLPSIRTQEECKLAVELIKTLIGDSRPAAQERLEALLMQVEKYLL